MAELKGMKDIMKNMRKQHGEAGLFAADENIVVKVDLISTGSYLVDDCLGGGIPRGRFIQMAGAESSGKTLLSLSTMAEWQKQNSDNWGVFIDAEYTFDPDWAEGLGVDLSRLMVLKENSGIKIFEFLVGKPHKEIGKPKIKTGILDDVITKGPDHGLGLIILDSVAAMIPPIEAIADVGKQNMAVMGRFLPAELRKLTPLLADANVAMIGINQVRINPGQMYGNPEQSSGGSALKHACSQMIHLGKRSGKDSFIMSGETEIGCTVGVKIDKNKVATPHKKAEFKIEYLTGVAEKNIEILELAIKYGVISKPNNRTYEFEGNKYTSRADVENWLSDFMVQETVYEKIKEARIINPNGVIKENTKEDTEE